MRNCKDKSSFRLQLVLYAQKHGVKPAAGEFETSTQTVRYWLKRFDGTKTSLEDRSREPHQKPRKLTPQQEAELIQLKKRYPRRGALWLKMNFNLPYAQKTFYRVWHDAGLVKQHKRKKHQTKRYLREVKRQ